MAKALTTRKTSLSEKKHKILEQECNRLFQTKGVLQASDLVAVASDDTHPLHDLFEWDDSLAAQKYREAQARILITVVRVETPSGNDLPKYVNVKFLDDKGNKQRGYVTLDLAMKEQTLKEQIISAALREVRHWESKYKDYQELGGIINEDQVEELEASLN